MGQHSPKMGQHRPKMGQHRLEMDQHSPEMGPPCPQDRANPAVKLGQPSPKMCELDQHSPKMGPHCRQAGATWPRPESTNPKPARANHDRPIPTHHLQTPNPLRLAKNPRFTVFRALSMFPLFRPSWLQMRQAARWTNIGLRMGQHSPQDGAT